MNWIEEILIICGISLDIFASMTCEGALVAKIEKKHLILLCSWFAGWQVLTLYLGNLLTILMSSYIASGQEKFLGRVIAATIFICLGIRLIRKAWVNERIIEKREEHLSLKRQIVLLFVNGIYTFLTGVAFGFLDIQGIYILIMMFLISILVVYFGMYTGYRLGFEHKFKAYVVGAILLIIAGIDVIIKYLI